MRKWQREAWGFIWDKGSVDCYFEYDIQNVLWVLKLNLSLDWTENKWEAFVRLSKTLNELITQQSKEQTPYQHSTM